MRVPTENLVLTTLDRGGLARRSLLTFPASLLQARASTRARRALIVGTCPIARQLGRDLHADCAAQRRPLMTVGFVALTPEEAAREAQTLPVVGTLGDLDKIARTHDADLILVADSYQLAPATALAPAGVRVVHASQFCEVSWRKVPSYLLETAWFDLERGFRLLNRPIDDAAKRVFDVVFSALLLVLLVPLMLLVALAIVVDNWGPVFYHQKRTGRGGVPFYVHKFRSMRPDAEKFGAQWATERDPRITRVGRILRLTRLDELPQFWNVLCGQMSLIGPRPERPEFDAQLSQEIPHYDARYRVRPGISGWAQVCYRYGASVDDARQKLAYDLYYLKHGSALLDAVILLRTLQVVFLGKGR